MTKLFKTIHNIETGEIIQEELTAEDLAIKAADEAEAIAKKAAKVQAEADKAIATAKLSALGLTADDLKALGLGSN